MKGKCIPAITGAAVAVCVCFMGMAIAAPPEGAPAAANSGAPGEASGEVEVKEVAMAVEGDKPISFRLTVLRQAVDVEEVHKKLSGQSWALAFHKSKVWAADSYEEWTSYVSDDYRTRTIPNEERFAEAKRAGLARRSSGASPKGQVRYWLEAELDHNVMLYVVQHLKLTPDAEAGSTIKMFVKANGRWLSHSKDELNLVTKLRITDLPALTRQLKLDP